MTETNATVYLVDDEPAVRVALKRLLRSAGFEVSDFASATDFLAAYDASRPGCLVLDLSMPVFDGLYLQHELSRRHAALPIIFLSGHGDVSSSVQAMKRGAMDFLIKPVDDEALLTAVRAAMERERSLREERSELSVIEDRVESLTAREREVLEHIVAGELNKQIAASLGTVEKTIKVHRARVMAKMQARSLAGLVRLAGRVGIGSALEPIR